MERDYKQIERDHFIKKSAKCTCKPEGICILIKDVCNMEQCPFVLWDK